MWREPVVFKALLAHLPGTRCMGDGHATPVVDRSHRSHEAPIPVSRDGCRLVSAGRGETWTIDTEETT
jgi:hypothetical protein